MEAVSIVKLLCEAEEFFCWIEDLDVLRRKNYGPPTNYINTRRRRK